MHYLKPITQLFKYLNLFQLQNVYLFDAQSGTLKPLFLLLKVRLKNTILPNLKKTERTSEPNQVRSKSSQLSYMFSSDHVVSLLTMRWVIHKIWVEFTCSQNDFCIWTFYVIQYFKRIQTLSAVYYFDSGTGKYLNIIHFVRESPSRNYRHLIEILL